MPNALEAAGLDVRWTRASTLASWMEALTGTVHVVGTAGGNLPRGNWVHVNRAGGWDPATSGVYMACLRTVWECLKHIGVPMPEFKAKGVPMLLQPAWQ